MTSRGKIAHVSTTKTNVTCDFATCDDYSSERLAVLQQTRSLLTESDLGIFTSSIRIGIMFLLLKMESACVCEIQYALNEPRQSLVSHHLRAMKNAGWLHNERWKKWTFYGLVPKKKEEMSSLIQGFAH
ncbi:MAG: ArsR family transcriptional regulator [Candidatus Thorarchaeota archaeon]|jgi:DNA-binding transcriptional ArsR family regulator